MTENHRLRAPQGAWTDGQTEWMTVRRSGRWRSTPLHHRRPGPNLGPLATLLGMEPTEALRSIETVLRSAIRSVAPGRDWLSLNGAPAEAALEGRRQNELDKRDGALPSADLLDYAMTPDVIRVINQNWESFAPIFKDEARTRAYLGIVEDVRNSIAHSRSLVPFERETLSGIAGQLANQLSIHLGSIGAAAYYPTIESLTDGFGSSGMDPQARYQTAPSGPRLEVGQRVRFTGKATSARGREVAWYMNHNDFRVPGWPEPVKISEGLGLDYELVIAKSAVGERFPVYIFIASDSTFHRTAHAMVPCDDIGYFYYAVNPPFDE